MGPISIYTVHKLSSKDEKILAKPGFGPRATGGKGGRAGARPPPPPWLGTFIFSSARKRTRAPSITSGKHFSSLKIP